MQKLPFKLVTKDYDYYSPLSYGDVGAEGLDLHYERDTAHVLDRMTTEFARAIVSAILEAF